MAKTLAICQRVDWLPQGGDWTGQEQLRTSSVHTALWKAALDLICLWRWSTGLSAPPYQLVINPLELSQSKLWYFYILVWLFWISPELTVAWLFECWLHSGWAPPTNFEDSFFFFCCITRLALKVMYPGLVLEPDRVASRLPVVGYSWRDPMVYTRCMGVTYVPIVLGNSFFFSKVPTLTTPIPWRASTITVRSTVSMVSLVEFWAP